MKKTTLLTFGFCALITGTAISQNARLQVIHNSADAAAEQVDVYVNGDMFRDNFAFRTATPYVDVPAGVELTISIAPSNSTSSADAIAEFTYTLDENETYVIVANGIVSANGYNPSPEFNLYVELGRETALSAQNTDVLVFHGSTDAPVVDVVVPGTGTIVDNLAYGEFAGYLELQTTDYTLNVTDETGNTVVASYLAPLSTLELGGEALVVLASGFLDPSANNNGPAFGLFVALPEGGNLIPLPEATVGIESVKRNELKVYPNPSSDFINIVNSEANSTIMVVDAMGRVVKSLNNISDENVQLDLSNLTPGVYQAVLKSNSRIITSTVIKQ
jgi:hypothetical protein